MRFNIDDATVYLLDKDKSLSHEMILCCAKAGGGKTILCESIAQEYFNKAKATVIILGDPKSQCEWMYQSLIPTDPNHLQQLKNIGREPKSIPCIHYEPYMDFIPKTNLPKIKFYTFDLSKFGKTDFQAIVETDSDSEIIRLLTSTARSLRGDDGLYALMDKIKNSVGKDDIVRKEDPNAFFVKASLGNKRSLGDIASFLLPYKDHYFLASPSCPLNLDFPSILQDNEHYHVFCVSHWVKDEKVRDLITLFLLNGFMRAQSEAKHPVLFVIPEIKAICPAGCTGYKKFLSNGIKQAMSLGRASGRKGMSFLLDSQNYSGIDLDVRNSATISFFGELGGLTDISNVCKSLGLNMEMRKKLTKMDYDFSFICSLMSSDRDVILKPLFPSGGHCEEYMWYYDEVKKQKPHEQQSYLELVRIMRLRYKEEFNLFKVKSKESQIKHQEKTDINKRKEKIKQTKDLLKKGYLIDEIAVELGVSSATVEKYIKEAKVLIKKEGGNIPNTSDNPIVKRTANKDIIRLICLEKTEANKEGKKCSLRMLEKKYKISKSVIADVLKDNLKFYEEEVIKT